MDFLAVAGASVAATTGASSAVVALPLDGAGNTAKFVRIASKGTVYVRPALSGGSVTASNGILVNQAESLYLNVGGFTHIAHIQDAAAVGFTITPVDMR